MWFLEKFRIRVHPSRLEFLDIVRVLVEPRLGFFSRRVSGLKKFVSVHLNNPCLRIGGVLENNWMNI